MFLIKKNIYILSLFIFVALSALSCGLRVGEQGEAPHTEGFSVGCLNGIGQKVDLYLKGQLEETQITQTANCLKVALTVFKDRVHGQKVGEFTPYELRKFIQDLFLQDNIIRDKLLNQLARLKTVIIGGEENKLTSEDIERFILFVDILKKEAIFFQPYFQAFYVLNQNNKEGDISRLKTIEKDLKKSVNRVSVFFKSFANPYDLKNMEMLFQELDFFPDHHHNISHLKEKINLLGALKNFIFGQSDSLIRPKQWDTFLTAFAYLISAHVNWTVLKKQNQWISPQGTTHISSIINDLIQLLSLTVQNRPHRLADTNDFLNLSKHLKQAGFLPERMGKTAMNSLWNILFGSVFVPQHSKPSGHQKEALFQTQALSKEKAQTATPFLPESRHSQVTHQHKLENIPITAEHINQVQQFLQLWTATQSFLDYTYTSKDLTPLPIKARSFFSSPDLWAKGEVILNDIVSMKALYKQSRKIHLSTDMYDQTKSLDYKNIKIYSFYRFITEMIQMGYKKTSPEGQGLSQEELEVFFTDFMPLAINMGWLSPRTKTSVMREGEAEFIVANILTTSAKGFHLDWQKEEYLTSKEMVEYIAYAFSFAFQLAEIGPVIFKTCAENPQNPPSEHLNWKNSQYNKDCVQLHLLSLLKKHTKNLPDFQKSLESMDEHKKQELAEALIHISYETEEKYQQADYMNKENLKNIIMALYFVETTVTRYDTNKNLTLEHEEIKNAFPTFQGYLSRMSINLICEQSDDYVPDFYAYAIKHEVLPASDTLKTWDSWIAQTKLFLHRQWRKQGYDYWTLFLDRTKLTRVFSSLIKGLLYKKKARQGQDCSPENDDTKNQEVLPEISADSP